MSDWKKLVSVWTEFYKDEYKLIWLGTFTEKRWRLYSPRCTSSDYLIATMDAGKNKTKRAQAWADSIIAAREKNLRTDRKPGVEGKEEGMYQFKPGDKVVLKPKEELCRPEWKYQEIGIGTVRTDTTPLPLTADSWIMIQWADDSRNVYFARDVLSVREGEPAHAHALASERAVAILHANGYSVHSRNSWNSQTCPAPACSPHILGPKEDVHIVYHGMNSGCGEESRGKTVDCCIAVMEDGSLKFGDGHRVGECPFLKYIGIPKMWPERSGSVYYREGEDTPYVLGSVSGMVMGDPYILSALREGGGRWSRPQSLVDLKNDGFHPFSGKITLKVEDGKIVDTEVVKTKK